MLFNLIPSTENPFVFYEELIVNGRYDYLEQSVYDINQNSEVHSNRDEGRILLKETVNGDQDFVEIEVKKEITDLLKKQKRLLIYALEEGIKMQSTDKDKEIYTSRQVKTLIYLLDENVNKTKYRTFISNVNKALFEVLKFLHGKYHSNIKNDIIKTVDRRLRLIELKVKDSILTFNYPAYSKNSYKLELSLIELKEGDFIHSDTNPTNFLEVFNKSKLSRPIVWTGGISTLSYFIKRLYEMYPNICEENQKWPITINCFVDEDGTEFTKDRLQWQKHPKKTKKDLDAILSGL